MAEEKETKTAEVKAPAAKAKKKNAKAPVFGVVHVFCSFNNTIVTVSDDKGNTIAWSTDGSHGFKGTKNLRRLPRKSPAPPLLKKQCLWGCAKWPLKYAARAKGVKPPYVP